jgi:putative sigma-54 modulation protein
VTEEEEYMQINFTGRGLDIQDEMREFVEGKLERLKKHRQDIRDVQVVLSTEKYRKKAEISFLAYDTPFHGSEETDDMRQSIDRVIVKLDKQLLNHKGKIRTRKRNSHESIRTADAPAESSKPRKQIEVVPIDQAQIKPMPVEEAIDELIKFEQQFLMFINPDTEAANVVFFRKDGNIGHFAPAK